MVRRLGVGKQVFSDLSDLFQKIYEEFAMDGKFVDICKMVEITDVSPTTEIIQEGYNTYLLEGKFISFVGLKKKTGIDPDPNMIQRIYKNYADKNDQLWSDRLEKLKKITGIAVVSS